MHAEPTGPWSLPLDPTHAALALENASDREQIFELVLQAARSRTRFAALLSVYSDHLRGRRAVADDGFDTSGISSLQLPRVVPALEIAIASCAPAVVPLATGELFVDGLLELIGGSSPTALILPISIGARTVALVVAHCGDADVPVEDVVDLFPLVAATGPALERVLAPRSQIMASPPPVRPEYEPPPELEVLPSTATKRAVLAELRDAEAWDELGAAIRELIHDGTTRGDPGEDERLDLFVELGWLELERLGRPERALEAWRSAQVIDASDARVLDALESLFVRQGRWLDCLELLDKRVALVESQRQRIAILLNIAAVAHDRLDDAERAAAAYERILGWDPAHEVASRELEALYTTGKLWQPLAALLLDRASRLHDLDSLIRCAQLYEREVHDLHGAFLVWLAVARRDPNGTGWLDELERLAPATGAWDDVVSECSALADELEVLHPEPAVRIWRLVARWSRDRAGDRRGAATAFDRVLRLTGDDDEALPELIALLRADSRWLELIALLAPRADAIDDPVYRAERYIELAQLHHAVEQHAEAIAAYENALANAPPDPTAILLQLRPLYQVVGAHEKLAELLPQLIDAVALATPRSVIVELHVELGNVLGDHLDRPDPAIDAYRDALALDMKHVGALRGLARVYEATGETDAYLDTTEEEVDVSRPAEQLERYGSIATAWHEQTRFDRAAACWRKLLALEPRNFAAHQGLARALAGGEHWTELATALRVHAKLADGREQIEPLLELAYVLEDRLDDAEGAVAAYQEVTALDPNHRGALDELARLHDRAGRAQPALAALQRLLELTVKDFRARADLLARIGHAHLAAHDMVNARVHFAQAIALDLEHARAHEGMARVCGQQSEFVAACEHLERAAQLAATPQDRLRCLGDAAWIYRHRLGDAERARACLHRILERDAEHTGAKQALAVLLAETGRWHELWPHLEEQIARAAELPPRERCELYAHAARCATELAKHHDALALIEAACALAEEAGLPPRARAALLFERADALRRTDALEAAAAAYQSLAIHHAQSLERAQLIGAYRQLAQIHTALGRPAQAQLCHQKVLDLDPRHRETLHDLVELNVSRGRFDEAIAGLRTIAAGLPDAERVGILERIGDLYRDKLGNTARATATYHDALELDAGNHRILQRLLDLHSDAGQWKAAVQTIDRFLAHERDALRRGQYFLASAEIRRIELRDRAGALACYEDALDELLRDGPSARPAARARALDAFRALHDFLANDLDWKQLEQSYRRMLRRLPPGDPALLRLWDELGNIYRSGLYHPQSALEALEVAHALDPDKSPHRARILTELRATVAAAAARAAVVEPSPPPAPARAPSESGVAPAPARAPSEPQAAAAPAPAPAPLTPAAATSPEALHALASASLEAGRIDEAWCACRALVYQKQATTDEEALYRCHQAYEAVKGRGALDDAAWANVRHSDEERVLGEIFAQIWESAVVRLAGPPKWFDLAPKERIAIEEGTSTVAKIFRHAARVVGVAIPDVYVQPRRAGRLVLVNCLELELVTPTIIVGSELMTGYRDTEIAAAIGATLAQLRPEYYLKLALPSVEELEAVLAAIAQLVGHSLARPEPPLTYELLPELQRQLTDEAADAVAALLPRLPANYDLHRWRAAVDAAADRAGLLVAGEFAAAARMASNAPELLAYSVSPSYFAARRHLGVAIG